MSNTADLKGLMANGSVPSGLKEAIGKSFQERVVADFKGVKDSMVAFAAKMNSAIPEQFRRRRVHMAIPVYKGPHKSSTRVKRKAQKLARRKNRH